MAQGQPGLFTLEQPGKRLTQRCRAFCWCRGIGYLAVFACIVAALRGRRSGGGLRFPTAARAPRGA